MKASLWLADFPNGELHKSMFLRVLRMECGLLLFQFWLFSSRLSFASDILLLLLKRERAVLLNRL